MVVAGCLANMLDCLLWEDEQLLLLATQECRAGLARVALLRPWGVHLAPVRAGRRAAEAYFSPPFLELLLSVLLQHRPHRHVSNVMSI